MIDFIFHTVEVIGSNPIAPTIPTLADSTSCSLKQLNLHAVPRAGCEARIAREQAGT